MAGVEEPMSQPSEAVPFVIDGVINPEAIEELCARLRRLLADKPARARVTTVICDVAALGHPDLSAIDALARLQLVTERCGRSMRLRDPSRALIELIRFVGLDEILCPSSGPAATDAGNPGPPTGQ